MYKVIVPFVDLQDAKETKSGVVFYPYEVGDNYPRKGLNPTKERINELLTSENRRGMPLIEEVKKPRKKKAEAAAK